MKGQSMSVPIIKTILFRDEILASEFLYSQQYKANLSLIRQMLMDGSITIWVDYDRAGWSDDGVIYRITPMLIEGDPK